MNMIKQYAKAFAANYMARYSKHYMMLAVTMALNLLFLTLIGVELTTMVIAGTAIASSIQTQLFYIRNLLEGKNNG